MRKDRPIDWPEALRTYIDKRGMNEKDSVVSGGVKKAEIIADALGSKNYSVDPMKSRKELDSQLSRAVKGLYPYYPPRGGWNGLILFRRIAVFTLDDFRCVYCCSPAEGLDHLVSKQYWKKNIDSKSFDWERIANLVASCRECNTGKKNRLIPEFRNHILDTDVSKRLSKRADVWKKEFPEYATLLERKSRDLQVFAERRWRVLDRMEKQILEEFPPRTK